MFQLEPYKITKIHAPKHEPYYCLGRSPANARAMAADDLGNDAMQSYRYRCRRVKDTSELPKDVLKQLRKNQREWNKHVNDHKRQASLAIYSLVEGISATDAEAVVNEIALGQIPHVSLNIFGELSK